MKLCLQNHRKPTALSAGAVRSLLIVGMLLLCCQLATTSQTRDMPCNGIPRMLRGCANQPKSHANERFDWENSKAARTSRFGIIDGGSTISNSVASVDFLGDQPTAQSQSHACAASTDSSSSKPTKDNVVITYKRLLQDAPAWSKALSISTSNAKALPDAELGVAYRADLKPLNPSADYSFSQPLNLPIGLQLRNNSITGVPKASGTFTITLMATANQRSISQSYNLYVRGLELIVSGDSRIYQNRQSILMMIVRGGILPIKITIEDGPNYCQIQDYQLFCMPTDVGPFDVYLLVTDRSGNTLRQTVSLQSINDPNSNLRTLQAAVDANNPANSNVAHNAVLYRFPTKCKLASNLIEYYSGIQIVVIFSANHLQLTLKDGTIVMLQQCTTRQFVSTILVRDFQAGCKIVFAGVLDSQTQRYAATKILKIADA